MELEVVLVDANPYKNNKHIVVNDLAATDILIVYRKAIDLLAQRNRFKFGSK